MQFIKDNMWLLISILIVLIVLIVSIIIFVKSKNKDKKEPVNNEVLDTVFKALGIKNIVSVAKEQDRIKLILVDPKLVDAKTLSDLKIPAFLKGKEVKLLYRNYSNELFNYINDRLDDNIASKEN